VGLPLTTNLSVKVHHILLIIEEGRHIKFAKFIVGRIGMVESGLLLISKIHFLVVQLLVNLPQLFDSVQTTSGTDVVVE